MGDKSGIKIDVKAELSYGKTIFLKIYNSKTVWALKHLILEKEGIPVEDIKIILNE